MRQKIPEEVEQAAIIVANYFEREEIKDWRLCKVASRDLVETLEGNLKKATERLWNRIDAENLFHDTQTQELGRRVTQLEMERDEALNAARKYFRLYTEAETTRCP